MMEPQNDTTPPVIVDQRVVRVDETGTEISALRVASGEIYVPVRALCAALGLDTNGQIQRMRRQEAIAEMLRTLTVPTAGGAQSLVCLELEGLPLWLAGVEAKRVRAALRERLVTYQRWARRRIYTAAATHRRRARYTLPPHPRWAPALRDYS